MPNTRPVRGKEEIEKWISCVLMDLLGLKAEEVNPRTPFDRYGLDSSAAIGITDALGTWMGRTLSPTLFYDYPTIEAVALYLTEEDSHTAAGRLGSAPSEPRLERGNLQGA